MDTILHMLGICSDHNNHINILSALAEIQHTFIYIKNYFRL
jgi:hypothetical protein